MLMGHKMQLEQFDLTCKLLVIPFMRHDTRKILVQVSKTWGFKITRGNLKIFIARYVLVIYGDYPDTASQKHNQQLKVFEIVFTFSIIDPHPNTYTFTKRLAEMIVSDMNDKLPVVIGRPSIGKVA